MASLSLELSPADARATERAIAAVTRARDRLPASWEPLARLLLRSEGVASSAVELGRAPLEEVAAAEVEPLLTGPSSWVADNLATVARAVAEAPGDPLSVATLLAWHARLMAHADAGQAGRLRESLVWVGGAAPASAAYVGPPPELVPGLLEDLVAFANRTDLDAVTQAAVAHAQFESIHPFADGNGRLGRVLIAWVVARRLEVPVPPPFSVFVARDAGGYLSGLTLYRLGQAGAWVRWFATTLERSANGAADLVDAIEALLAQWRTRAGHGEGRATRTGATLWRLIELLPAYPVVSSSIVARECGVTDEAARMALHHAAALGIVEPAALRLPTRGRPTQWWVASEVLALVARA
ncbi:MAG TPA: Fic family protein [Acidimicrobiales bacterium]|nr:Fic family protein [Acidimicrobiales bacterium]